MKQVPAILEHIEVFKKVRFHAVFRLSPFSAFPLFIKTNSQNKDQIKTGPEASRKALESPQHTASFRKRRPPPMAACVSCAAVGCCLDDARKGAPPPLCALLRCPALDGQG